MAGKDDDITIGQGLGSGDLGADIITSDPDLSLSDQELDDVVGGLGRKPALKSGPGSVQTTIVGMVGSGDLVGNTVLGDISSQTVFGGIGGKLKR